MQWTAIGLHPQEFPEAIGGFGVKVLHLPMSPADPSKYVTWVLMPKSVIVSCYTRLEVSALKYWSPDAVLECLSLVSVSWKSGKISVSSQTQNQDQKSRSTATSRLHPSVLYSISTVIRAIIPPQEWTEIFLYLFCSMYEQPWRHRFVLLTPWPYHR